MADNSTSPASAPEMVPSAEERASLIRSECWRLDAETEITNAFLDGRNVGLAAQPIKAPPPQQTSCHLIGGNDGLFCTTHKADAPNGICEDAPPQPGDAERMIEPVEDWTEPVADDIWLAKQRRLAAHRPHGKDGLHNPYTQGIAARFLRLLDAAQSALAESQKLQREIEHEQSRQHEYHITRLEFELGNAQSALAESWAEVAQLRAEFMNPPECDASCDDPMCPYVHQWTRKDVALQDELAESRAEDVLAAPEAPQ